MFDKLQEILVRPLNGYETSKLIQWKNNKIYTEEEILNAYEYCKVKDINYIQKYLENNKKEKPEWFDKNITDEPLESKELLEYQKEMKEFYDSDEEWKERTEQLLKESEEYYKNRKGIK